LFIYLFILRFNITFKC